MAASGDQQLFALAASQHGLVTIAQVRAAGLGRAAWRHRIGTGQWDAVTPRVARCAGSPRTWHQRLLAAVFDVGDPAYVSHVTAAALWGIGGFEPEPVHLIVLRGDRETPSRLAVVHRPRHLPQPFGATLQGVPVVRPALLVLQLAAVVSPERLRRIFDRLWSRRLLSAPSVRHELRGVMHRGRAGTGALRALLDSLPADYVPPASALESRVDGILALAGYGPMRRQVDLGDSERWCGRVDLLDPKLPLILEVDGEAYHSALSDVESDRERESRLAAAGFAVVRAFDTEVWHRPSLVVERYAAARRALLRARAA